jgi:hypothetical protein
MKLNLGIFAPDNYALTLPGNLTVFADGNATATPSTYFGLSVVIPNRGASAGVN